MSHNLFAKCVDVLEVEDLKGKLLDVLQSDFQNGEISDVEYTEGVDAIEDAEGDRVLELVVTGLECFEYGLVFDISNA